MPENQSVTLEYLNKLFKESESPCIELIGPCQGCGTKVSLVIFQKEMEVNGNGGMIIGRAYGDRPEFKCSACLEKDGGMISPQRTEVFSRVCGYLRPRQNYNPGKKAEFMERKNFKFS